MFPRVCFILLLSALICSAALPVLAQDAEEEDMLPSLNVIHFYSHEKKSLDLPRGKRGDIRVFLASDGEMLNGYFVSLIRLKDRKLVKTRKSDRHGVIVFDRIPPGDYSLLLRKSMRLRKENTVRIGDVLLNQTGKSQRRKKQDEYYY